MAQRHYKSINFDLNTKKLIECYPSQHYRKAYRDIKNLLNKNGFEHRQWSGYRSKEKITTVELMSTVEQLYTSFPWFEKCINRLDATNIGKDFDLKAIFFESKNISLPIKNVSVDEKKSIHEVLAQAKEKSDVLNANRPIKPKSKTKEIQR